MFYHLKIRRCVITIGVIKHEVHIMPLVINSLRGGHTYTNITTSRLKGDFKKPVGWRALGLKILPPFSLP